jgi:hypothetical protein
VLVTVPNAELGWPLFGALKLVLFLSVLNLEESTGYKIIYSPSVDKTVAVGSLQAQQGTTEVNNSWPTP